VVWVPPMSVFDQSSLCCGDFRLELNPQNINTYQQLAVESRGAATATFGNSDGDLKFEVTDMQFYAACCRGPNISDLTYYIDMSNNIQVQQSGVGNPSFQQRSYDIPESTYAVAVAYIDSRRSDDTRVSNTDFKIYSDDITGDTLEDLAPRVNRWFFQYAGQKFPQIDYDGFKDGTTDFTTAGLYYDTQIANGSVCDSPESKDDFVKKGVYWYFNTPKSGDDRSTRLQLWQSFQLAGATGGTVGFSQNANSCVMSMSRAVAKIEIKQGRCVSCMVEDI